MEQASKGDLRTLANGLLPSGFDPGSLTPEGRDEVRAAIDIVLRIWDYTRARYELAIEQLNNAADEIDRLKNEIERLRPSANVLSAADTRTERREEKLIDERDAAEECLSQMYYLVTGHSPEWSNKFGHAEALEDVADALDTLRQVARESPLNRPDIADAIK